MKKHLIIQKDGDRPKFGGLAKVFGNHGDPGILSDPLKNIPDDARVVVAHSSSHSSNINWWLRQSQLNGEEWWIWWHKGGVNSAYLKAAEISKHWRQRTGESERESAFIRLGDLHPLPYSRDAGDASSDWDTVVGNFLNGNATIEELNAVAMKAHDYYYGFAQLKDNLARCLRHYIPHVFKEDPANSEELNRLIGNVLEDLEWNDDGGIRVQMRRKLIAGAKCSGTEFTSEVKKSLMNPDQVPALFRLLEMLPQ